MTQPGPGLQRSRGEPSAAQAQMDQSSASAGAPPARYLRDATSVTAAHGACNAEHVLQHRRDLVLELTLYDLSSARAQRLVSTVEGSRSTLMLERPDRRLNQVRDLSKETRSVKRCLDRSSRAFLVLSLCEVLVHKQDMTPRQHTAPVCIRTGSNTRTSAVFQCCVVIAQL